MSDLVGDMITPTEPTLKKRHKCPKNKKVEQGGEILRSLIDSLLGWRDNLKIIYDDAGGPSRIVRVNPTLTETN